ncbi:MAG: 4-hydroxythreonine-4-phosphate dehydrogenase PdxA [Candidatus Omnitrophota bacterium]
MTKNLQNDGDQKPVIGITLGDPCGIGPEITAKALSIPGIRRLADFVLIGDKSVYDLCLPVPSEDIRFCDLKLIKKPDDISVKERGAAAFAYLKKAVEFIKDGSIQGLVTAPLNKQVVINGGAPDFHGHTEMLAEAFQVKNVEMMFAGGPFKTIIATRHIPLKYVASSLTPEALLNTIRLSHSCLKDIFKIPGPRIALCGINPHAGEGGKIGTEELDIIIPAMKKAGQEGIMTEGPFAADTLFIPFNAMKYDLIIAMYHDQGLAPIKALYFTKLVNLTIGLPFIRTSTAHGTAEDIAGQNKADPSSMIEAIKMACELTRNKFPGV